MNERGSRDIEELSGELLKMSRGDLDDLLNWLIRALHGDGYVLVPREPTRKMLEAGRGGYMTNDPLVIAREIYRAMIAAGEKPL